MSKLNKLERAVIQRLLERAPDVLQSTIDYSAIEVVARDFTGCGFFIEFDRDVEALKLFHESTSELITHVVGAKLGVTETDSSYLFYTKNGYLTDVEGVTYGGDNWPEDGTETFSLHDMGYDSISRHNRPEST